MFKLLGLLKRRGGPMRESDGTLAYERTRTDEANFLEPNRIEFVIAREHVIVG